MEPDTIFISELLKDTIYPTDLKLEIFEIIKAIINNIDYNINEKNKIFNNVLKNNLIRKIKGYLNENDYEIIIDKSDSKGRPIEIMKIKSNAVKKSILDNFILNNDLNKTIYNNITFQYNLFLENNKYNFIEKQLEKYNVDISEIESKEIDGKFYILWIEKNIFKFGESGDILTRLESHKKKMKYNKIIKIYDCFNKNLSKVFEDTVKEYCNSMKIILENYKIANHDKQKKAEIITLDNVDLFIETIDNFYTDFYKKYFDLANTVNMKDLIINMFEKIDIKFNSLVKPIESRLRRIEEKIEKLSKISKCEEEPKIKINIPDIIPEFETFIEIYEFCKKNFETYNEYELKYYLYILLDFMKVNNICVDINKDMAIMLDYAKSQNRFPVTLVLTKNKLLYTPNIDYILKEPEKNGLKGDYKVKISTIRTLIMNSYKKTVTENFIEFETIFNEILLDKIKNKNMLYEMLNISIKKDENIIYMLDDIPISNLRHIYILLWDVFVFEKPIININILYSKEKNGMSFDKTRIMSLIQNKNKAEYINIKNEKDIFIDNKTLEQILIELEDNNVNIFKEFIKDKIIDEDFKNSFMSSIINNFEKYFNDYIQSNKEHKCSRCNYSAKNVLDFIDKDGKLLKTCQKCRNKDAKRKLKNKI